jgi:hypothetical protein
MEVKALFIKENTRKIQIIENMLLNFALRKKEKSKKKKKNQKINFKKYQ